MIQKVYGHLSPFEAYQNFKLASVPSVLLESTRVLENGGRYSIVCTDPFLIFEAKASKVSLTVDGKKRVLKANPIKVLRDLFKKYS